MSAPLANDGPYRGAGWLEVQLAAKKRQLSAFGVDVANILGATYRGLYHLEREVLHDRVDWARETCIILLIRGELSTVDGQELAELVVRCADAGIRLAIAARAPRYLELQFTRGAGLFIGQAVDADTLVERIRAARGAE